jgi:hypothetical protein
MGAPTTAGLAGSALRQTTECSASAPPSRGPSTNGESPMWWTPGPSTTSTTVPVETLVASATRAASRAMCTDRHPGETRIVTVDTAASIIGRSPLHATASCIFIFVTRQPCQGRFDDDSNSNPTSYQYAQRFHRQRGSALEYVQTGLSINESSRAGVAHKREGSDGENQGIGGVYDPPETTKTTRPLYAGPLNDGFDSDSIRN